MRVASLVLPGTARMPPWGGRGAARVWLSQPEPRLPPHLMGGGGLSSTATVVLPSGRSALTPAEREAIKHLIDANARERMRGKDPTSPQAAKRIEQAGTVILAALDAAAAPLSTSDLQERCGLSLKTTREALQRLQRGGWVSRKRIRSAVYERIR